VARDDESSGGFFSRFLTPGSGFTTLAITAFVILAAFVLAALWRQYRPQVMAGHRISVESIEITPLPPWIRSDIKAEAALAGGLSGLSIREEDLTLRVAEAFRMHSWVAKVKRVSKKHPAQVIVSLEFREPVAMVEVQDRNVDGQFYEGGLYPIDVEGVLLPTGDFSPERASKFPRIAAKDAAPMSPPGAAWGDQRIHEAAVTAAALSPYWDELNLYRILAFAGPTDARGRRDVVLRMLTRGNTLILWGHAPGKEHDSEASVEKKIARLLQLKREKGSLDSVGIKRAIDVRGAERLEMASRPDDIFEK
jgi:hypothetical protein